MQISEETESLSYNFLMIQNKDTAQPLTYLHNTGAMARKFTNIYEYEKLHV